MKQTIQENALSRLQNSFDNYGLEYAAAAIGKWGPQISLWRHGGPMSRRTAELIVSRLTPSGRVRK